MILKFILFVFLTSVTTILSRQPSVFEWLRSNYLINKAPIFYYDNYKLASKPAYAYLCQQNAAGHYSLILEDESVVDVVFVQKDFVSTRRNRRDRFRTSSFEANKNASLAYQQALQRSMAGFGSSDFISTPQFQGPSMTDTNTSSGQNRFDLSAEDRQNLFIETIPYRSFPSYTRNNDPHIEMLKSIPKFGNIFVKDNKLHLVDHGTLDIIFELR